MSFKLLCDLIGGGDGHALRAGTLGTPVEFTGGTQLSDDTVSVTTSAATIYDNSSDLTDFDLLVLIPQATVIAEFIGGAANFKIAFKLLAGVPFILGSDDAASAIGASLETIKQINAKAVTGTAQVRRIVVT